MIKQNRALIGTVLLIGLVVLAVQYKKKSIKSTANYQFAVESFPVNGGWGYKVLVDRHPYIYQDDIPGLPGNQAFHSKEDALRVGTAVMKKMMEHKSPGITVEELRDMQIAEAQ
ncbi:DUF4907 domain-containing protein [Chitinophaga nivalis]|uniref:DUF4907 domain-containing protein n=1 Tax=Chitinophaga nivalis TaxID=2991709 RepID=A0ABT3IFM0_9BACT|nr:DUF4907 domain-containing protein [Chitinophaga nivalis]MCW3467555.1 DUF4907 domain-containing protein [Chitinophaga nivalis]MCW3482753.1 DUF4907 domain-containing protein [Chitinophaga nivalis]